MGSAAVARSVGLIVYRGHGWDVSSDDREILGL